MNDTTPTAATPYVQTLRGHQAIAFAEEMGDLPLNKYADLTEPATHGLTPSEARAIAREDAGLIWIAVDQRNPDAVTVMAKIAEA